MRCDFRKILFVSLLAVIFFNIGLGFVLADEITPKTQINIGSFTSASFSSRSNGTVNWISEYIGAIYRYGVGLAAILAVIMIMAGGFIWLMSAGSPDKVGKAKEFITSALTGLLLALFSFVILQTINPRLVQLDGLKVIFQEYPDEPIETDNIKQGCCAVPQFGSNQINGSSCVSLYYTDSQDLKDQCWSRHGLSSSIIVKEVSCRLVAGCDGYTGSNAGQAILESAQNSIDQPLGVCDATSGGRLGCAMAVNEIVENALGYPVGGGLSTQQMYNELLESDNFISVGNVIEARPGDIIITPGGHVGICETNNCTTIISNSSSQLTVQRNFSYNSWRRTYGTSIYIFRAL